MDGIKHRAVVQSWFDSAINNGGIDRYDDLHVDQIDSDWKPRSKWIASALESFEMALEVRDADVGNQHLTVVLAFALESDVHPQGMTFHNREELEKAFCSTPPSLYLLRPGDEFWTQAEESKGDKVSDDLVINTLSASELFGEMPENIKCIYMEYMRKDDEEYSRDLFLAG
jgi:hypothetical protein